MEQCTHGHGQECTSSLLASFTSGFFYQRGKGIISKRKAAQLVQYKSHIELIYTPDLEMLGRSLRFGEGIKGGMCIYLYKSSPKGWCVHHLSKSLTRVVESTTTITTTVGEMSEESDESVKLSRRRTIAIWSNEYCNQTYLSIVFPVEFIELKEDAVLGYMVHHGTRC